MKKDDEKIRSYCKPPFCILNARSKHKVLLTFLYAISKSLREAFCISPVALPMDSADPLSLLAKTSRTFWISSFSFVT